MQVTDQSSWDQKVIRDFIQLHGTITSYKRMIGLLDSWSGVLIEVTYSCWYNDYGDRRGRYM